MPGLMEALFLLAAWAVVPIGLRFLPESVFIRAARKAVPFAAALATVSFFLSPGIPAALLAAPWLGIDLLMALGGLTSLRAALRGGLPDLFIIAAMLFPPVGGVHLVASRLGHPLAGFPEPIVLLTAIHFHYTAFAAPILAALIAKSLKGGRAALAKAAGLGLVGGTPLLAAGFLFSPILKATAVGVLVVSVLLMGIAQLLALPGTSPRARPWLVISSLAIIVGMILAAVYEHGFYTGRSWLSISQMAWSHGLLNGLGFSLSGLAGWAAEHRREPIFV